MFGLILPSFSTIKHPSTVDREGAKMKLCTLNFIPILLLVSPGSAQVTCDELNLGAGTKINLAKWGDRNQCNSALQSLKQTYADASS